MINYPREKFLIEKVKKNLTEYPTGKILKFYWFREKKFGDKRIYYIIDEELKKILIIAFGSKKEQEGMIEYILQNMNFYLKKLKEI